MFNRTVKVQQGMLEGNAGSNPLITTFFGVPYGKPPVASLRWRAPQAPECWDGVYKAETYGWMPPQMDMFFAPEIQSGEKCYTEDVLRLNIWTPAKNNDDQLPVFVWYHGGGYQNGGAAGSVFNGERLAEKGIVVVTVGYRLGILGYLCHPDMEKESEYKTAGNFGLQDQAFALEWIQNNIHAFGGDPNKMTICGQSAGAASVCNLICSPLAIGKFRGAICQSGDGLMRIGDKNDSYEAALMRGLKLSQILGDGTLESMRALDYRTFVHGDYDAAVALTKAPCVPVQDGQILLDMKEILLKDRERNVPMIIGNNHDEGLPDISDEEWFARIAYWTRVREKQLGLPTWHYQFCRPARINGKEIGAVHSSELAFVFESYYDFGVFDIKDGDPAIASIMATYWSNFVKYQNPNGPGVPYWERKNASMDSHLCIDSEIQMTSDLYTEDMARRIDAMEKKYGIAVQ